VIQTFVLTNVVRARDNHAQLPIGAIRTPVTNDDDIGGGLMNPTVIDADDTRVKPASRRLSASQRDRV
jgi:hypothetical protein